MDNYFIKEEKTPAEDQLAKNSYLDNLDDGLFSIDIKQEVIGAAPSLKDLENL